MSILHRHAHGPLDERQIRTLIAFVYIAALVALYGYFILSHPTKERDSWREAPAAVARG